MTALRWRRTSTPLPSAAGLLVFAGFAGVLAGCHRGQPAPAPQPATSARTPARPTPTPAPTEAAAITSSPTLVRAMREFYTNSWYHTLTFRQRTTIVNTANGHEFVQTWYGAGALPGRLRIDTDLASKTGILYRRDSIYSFNAGKLVTADTGTYEPLMLGFDLFTQPAARSETELRRLGFDLSRFHEGTWQARPVFVVGAEGGDTTSKQFWVDRERLVVVRLLERSARGHSDLRFNKYVRTDKGAWVASEVEQYLNGKLRLREEYSDIRTGVPLADALFEPKEWAAVAHWTRP